MKTKHCVLMIVDALAHRIVKEQFERNNLPNISMLIKLGGNVRPCTSIFPSITPAATCSIATGVYPSEHGIEGACWYDAKDEEAAYLGDDLQLAWQRGFHNYLIDFGDGLNFERLKAPTIFELLHDHSIDSACVNYMWFAGPHMHQRATPLLLRLAAGRLEPTVRGPRFLKLGDFVEALPEKVGPMWSQGVFNRYGFDDEVTAKCMMAMAETNSLPPFTLAYFPKNDDASHDVGPKEAVEEALVPFDNFLGEWITAVGGWARLSQDVELIIVGDHGQNSFTKHSVEEIPIDQVLKSFSQSTIGKGWRDDETICICPNMRATSIYLRHEGDSLRRKVIDSLLADPRVDQVIYRPDDHQWRVETAYRGSLSFRHAEAAETATASDQYGNHWVLQGDLSCIDANVREQAVVEYGNYPNALERIASAFVATSSPIWVTARPGAEFSVDGARVHDGGSHGALYKDDAEAALITTSGINLGCLPCAFHPRIVDVVPLIMDALSICRDPQTQRSYWQPAC
jgi:hypothetical protein